MPENIRVNLKIQITGGFSKFVDDLNEIRGKLKPGTSDVSVYTMQGDRPWESDVSYLEVSGELA